jgi:hypothetical protein
LLTSAAANGEKVPAASTSYTCVGTEQPALPDNDSITIQITIN